MKEIYCNMCKRVTTDIHPLHKKICRACNEELKYTETGTKLVTVQEWGEMRVTIQYKPMPKQ